MDKPAQHQNNMPDPEVLLREIGYYDTEGVQGVYMEPSTPEEDAKYLEWLKEELLERYAQLRG